ncbi:UNKNOWN [Stylonychia lemnae]|uniref:Zinc-finger domain-containing protein n=1 Tax=Stylonychia lemnae TaxID=5949 RepID=A0A078AF04_STYLE|nr:UNKNOWN [Stylonychia lemnae]|eukprot:CDW80849.1 UNKNOWN [Stylonychia lemnae]
MIQPLFVTVLVNPTSIELLDKEEQKLLHDNLVFDAHFDERKPLNTQFLGYKMIKAQQNEAFNPDFFLHYNTIFNTNSIAIDEQIDWLSKELSLVKQQSKKYTSQLKNNMQASQLEEGQKDLYVKARIDGVRQTQIESLISLETKQIAESIQRIKATRNLGFQQVQQPYLFRKQRFEKLKIPQNIIGRAYLLEFDPSFKMDDQWVTDVQLHYLNILRDEMTLSIRQFTQNKIKKLIRIQEQDVKRRQIRQQIFEEEQMGFCHHCKQSKTTYIMAKCNYKSQVHGLLLPYHQEINCISVPNVEPHNTELVNHFILNKTILDKKKKKQYQDQVENVCDKQFCSFCLKNYYEIFLPDAQSDKDWVCPYCKGHCFCSRCIRQEQLTRVRGLLISNSIKDIQKYQRQPSKVLEQLVKQNNFIDNRIKHNFERIVRTCKISPLAVKGTAEDIKILNQPLFLEQLTHEDPINYIFHNQPIKTINVPKTRSQQDLRLETKVKKMYDQMTQEEREKTDQALQKSQKFIDQILQTQKAKKRDVKLIKKVSSHGSVNKRVLNDITLQKLNLSPKLNPPSLMSSAHSNSTADSVELAKKSSELDQQIPQRKPRSYANKPKNKSKQIKKEKKLDINKKHTQKKQKCLKGKAKGQNKRVRT